MNKIMENFDTILSLTKEVNDCVGKINRLELNKLGIKKAISRGGRANAQARREQENSSVIGENSATKALEHAKANKERVPENPTGPGPGPGPGRNPRE